MNDINARLETKSGHKKDFSTANGDARIARKPTGRSTESGITNT